MRVLLLFSYFKKHRNWNSLQHAPSIKNNCFLTYDKVLDASAGSLFKTLCQRSSSQNFLSLGLLIELKTQILT